MWIADIPSVDAVAAAEALAALPGLAFLDSAMHHDTLGRTSTLAADPFGRFRFRDGRATLDGRPVPGFEGAGSGLEALRACLAPYRTTRDPELPDFAGAPSATLPTISARPWSGWRPRPGGLACATTIAFNLYDTVLSIDHASGRCRLVATGFPETDPAARETPAQARLARFSELLAGVAYAEPRTPRAGAARMALELHPPRLRGGGGTGANNIRAGDIYQANIAPSASRRISPRASIRSSSTGACAPPTRRPSAPISISTD